MSDLPDDTDDQQSIVAAQSPALQEFQGAFTHPAAQDWSAEVSTRLNDYFQRRRIADDNIAAGQNFVDDIDQFKSGLVKMVQNDPHAVHTALDLVPPTMSALIDNMPNQPDNPDDHHAAITDHIQQSIAHAAITSAAEGHEGVARGLLADDRLKDILGDDAHKELTLYTDMQASAKARDDQAAAGQKIAADREVADQSGRNYLGALVDPNNGSRRSPPGWNQAVMADNRVPPADKVALFNAHEQLGHNGDARTDPIAMIDTVRKLASGAAQQRDLYPAIGSSMSMVDFGTLATAIRQPEFLNNLHQTFQAARQQFAPNGDLAETRALGRFVSWLMPQIRRGANVDPQHEDWVLGENGANLAQFRLTPDDLRTARPMVGERPDLSSIFQMSDNAPAPIQPNPLIPPNSEVGPSPSPIGGTESGSFFQRKLREQQPKGAG